MSHDETCGEARPHYHRDTADGEGLVFTTSDKSGQWFEAFLLLVGPFAVVVMLVGFALRWWTP